VLPIAITNKVTTIPRYSRVWPPSIILSFKKKMGSGEELAPEEFAGEDKVSSMSTMLTWVAVQRAITAAPRKIRARMRYCHFISLTRHLRYEQVVCYLTK
jgi:hypothetical protein